MYKTPYLKMKLLAQQTWTHHRELYCCSVAKSCPTLWDPEDCSAPGVHVLHPLLEHAQTQVHWVNDVIQPSHPLSGPSPTLNLSQHQGRVFSNESVLRNRWPEYWSFSFNISPFNEYSGLISFKMDWFDLLAVHETLKSHLQHHNSKASILHHSAFFRANFLNHTLLMEKR